MSTTIAERVSQDETASAISRAVLEANFAISERGEDPSKFFVRVNEDHESPTRVWEVYYIPRDYVTCRGGGLSVRVDEDTGKVLRVLRGQ